MFRFDFDGNDNCIIKIKFQTIQQLVMKNDIPITEEELKKKDTPINVNDVLQLKKPTKGID